MAPRGHGRPRGQGRPRLSWFILSGRSCTNQTEQGDTVRLDEDLEVPNQPTPPTQVDTPNEQKVLTVAFLSHRIPPRDNVF